MLSSILKHSGYTVGTYTSPHVVSFNERMAINGSSISSAALDALVKQYKSTIESTQQSENGAISHFEIVTALAFRYFADSKVDIAVIETGLGGTRDATNVLPPETVAAAVITAIGNDHAAALGGSIESIATAKAGIMKKTRPVVLGRQPETAAGQTLVQIARENNLIELIKYAEKEVNVVDEGDIFIQDGVAYQNCKFELSEWASNALLGDKKKSGEGGGGGDDDEAEQLDVQLRLVGKHQLDNAATAITTAAILAEMSTSQTSQSQSQITKESIIHGLENAPILPGRFQICRLEANQGLAILDGAHTPESAAALVDTVRSLFPYTDTNDQNNNSTSPPPPPVALVLAMASDKDLTGVCRELRQLQPNVAVFTEVPIAGGKTRSAAPGALVGAWQAAGMMKPLSKSGKKITRPVRARELIQASIKAAVARAAAELKSLPNGDEGIIVVTGSMHAVGTALKDL
jgi:folylpolyglutamate synthase/dihydrofolate synthase